MRGEGVMEEIRKNNLLTHEQKTKSIIKEIRKQMQNNLVTHKQNKTTNKNMYKGKNQYTRAETIGMIL